LDFRPASMYRETMDFWVQECPHCGYIKTRLDQPSNITQEEILKTHEEIESGFDWNRAFARKLAGLEKVSPSMFGAMLAEPAYRRRLSSDGQSEEKERFLWSMEWERTYAMRFAKFGAMLAKSGRHDEAAMQFLSVAWYFDDENNEDAATHWRKAAIEQMEIMRQRRKKPPYYEMLICAYADMLRRSGDFQAVINLHENELSEAVHVRMIKYQKELSMQGDRAAHKIAETGDSSYAEKGMYFGV